MMISSYFASIGISLEKGSIKKVDKALDHIENRLKKLGTFANKPITLSIGNFDVDQRRLNAALGTALDIASSRLVFEINRFAVDQVHLNRVMTAATIQASRVAGQSATIRPNLHVNRVGARTSHVAGAVGGGLIGRGVSGFYGPALALGLGGYGLSALNQRNQQVVSAQLQSSAVVQQAGGTAAQGADSFQYLRSEAKRIGFNYLDASGDYNKLISGLTGSGLGLGESQKVFSGFAELARVNKLDKTTQNRLFRALSQVAGKGKLQAEELTGQIAEALPGGTALFARAYQAQLRDRGQAGDLIGQSAIAKLQADMKKGLVTSDILKYAGRVASKDAEKGLPAAQTASQAEQQRYQNAVTDLAVIASESGVEEGFARIFRTLNAGLSESNGLVRALSEGFNEATKWADDLLLFPQSFIRALEGKDSLVSDWLGAKDAKELRQNWMDIKTAWKDITSIPQPSWMPDLLATTRELARLLDLVSKTLSTSQQAKGIIQEEYDKDPSTWGNIKGLAKANWFTFSNTMDAINPVDLTVAKNNWGEWLGIDSWKNAKPESGLVQGVDEINSQSSEAAKAAATDKAMGITNTNSNQIDIVVNVDGSTLQGLDAAAQAHAIGQAVADMFVTSFDQVNVQFPVK
jgi:tape measure protein